MTSISYLLIVILMSLHFCCQDCKEFQGELFGISNLFRDLSDKLFTSEIIELHENQVKEKDLNQQLKINFVPQTEGDSSKNEHQNKETSEPVFRDLGECIISSFLASFENFE